MLNLFIFRWLIIITRIVHTTYADIKVVCIILVARKRKRNAEKIVLRGIMTIWVEFEVLFQELQGVSHWNVWK